MGVGLCVSMWESVCSMTEGFKTDLPCVVIHCYTWMKDHERVFWERVRVRLREKGLELVLICPLPAAALKEFGWTANSPGGD